MTFTYSKSTISTDLAKVRLRIGDTDSTRQLLSDEEIAYTLTEYSTVVMASIECVKRILGQLARSTDRSAVGLSSSRSQAFQQYKDLLRELEIEAVSSAAPFFTGASQDEVDGDTEDSDYRGVQFDIGQDDNANSLNPETDE